MKLAEHVEQEYKRLLEENESLKAKNKYLQNALDLKNGGESRQILMIDSLKRIIDLQNAIRKIISSWYDYSESNDEIPNQWLVDIANIAEQALEKSTEVDYEFEIRKEVKELEAINKQLLEALGESAEIIKHDLNDWIMPTDRKERCLNYLSLLINNTKL